MDVQIGIPQTPVTLTPGAEARVRMEVCNRSTGAMALRLGVTRSRAGAWSHTDPPIVELAAGACTTVDVVFRPPANVLPGSTMLPFTVQAEDLQYGVTTGRATGLVTVAAPQRLHATLADETARRGPHRFTLSVANRADEPLTLRITARLDPPYGRVEVEPAVVDVPRGETATAVVRVRPRASVVGSPRTYAVVVSGHDAAAAEERPASVRLEATGTVRPWLGHRPATVLAAAVAVAAMVGGVLLHGLPDLPRLGRGNPPPAPPAASAPAVPAAAGTTQVRRPYVMLDAFPQRDGTRQYEAAVAERARLEADGVPVRLVDSRSSAEVDDGDGGLWVLLHDGLTSVADGEAYCARHRAVVPNCFVVR